MVELMVSAHGSKFFGTDRSTFYKYALRLHQLRVSDNSTDRKVVILSKTICLKLLGLDKIYNPL
ncbi:4589_t:CDS:1, partial [Ambispora gerdemannii]